MKPIAILEWICITFLTTAYSHPQTSAALFPVSQNGKLGYIDTTGKFVIAPQFTGAGKFCDGLAPVKVSKKWGYIDGQGKNAINPSFDEARPFSESRAAVKKGKKWGYIEKSGKFVVETQFDEALRFSQGLAPVKRGDQWGYIDMAGKPVTGFQFDEAFIFSDGRGLVGVGDQYGYIDRIGRLEIKPEFDWAGTFNHRLALVEKNDTLSYIDSTGTIALRPQFDDAGDFSEGLAPIQIGYLWGYMDTTGTIIIAPQFHAVGPFSEGLARVTVLGKTGFIDKAGQYVLQPTWDWAGDFLNQLAEARLGEMWGYIDQNGRFIFQAGVTSLLEAAEKLMISINPHPTTQPPDFVHYERPALIIKSAKPRYPDAARKACTEGTVWVKLWVNKKGKVRRVIIQQSDGEIFNQSAVAAARQFEFKPAMRQGKPVGVWYTIPPFQIVPFDLPPSSSEREVFLPNDEPPPDSVQYEKAPRPVKIVLPTYPEKVRQAGLKGEVWVKIWVDKSGRARTVLIQKSSNPIFEQSALDAAKQCEFRPALIKCNPVDAWLSMPYLFGPTELTTTFSSANAPGTADVTPPDFVPYEIEPKVIKSAPLRYPEIARKAGLEGKVWVKIWVGKTGRPVKAVIQKSASEIFDQAAIEAAMRMLFTPARTRAGPIDAWVSIPFDFKLK